MVYSLLTTNLSSLRFWTHRVRKRIYHLNQTLADYVSYWWQYINWELDGEAIVVGALLPDIKWLKWLKTGLKSEAMPPPWTKWLKSGFLHSYGIQKISNFK